MKKIKILCLIIFILIVFTACNKEEEKSEEIVMAVLMRNSEDNFLSTYVSSLKIFAEDCNVKLEILNADSNPNRQLRQVKGLLSKGVRLFIILPVNTEITERIAKFINEKDGFVVFSNVQPTVKALRYSKKFFLVSSLESMAGKIQAEIIDDYFKANPTRLKQNKSINVLLLLGQAGHPAQLIRTKAVIESLNDKGYNVNVLDKFNANWFFINAKNKMNEWIPLYGNDVDVIIANNDSMALGAVDALIENKYIDDPKDLSKDTDGDGSVLRVPVIGVDALSIALLSMRDKKLYGTVLQDANGQAKTAFEILYNIAKNGTGRGIVAGGISSVKDPVLDESPLDQEDLLDQCYMIPFKAVTKDKLDSLIIEACSDY